MQRVTLYTRQSSSRKFKRIRITEKQMFAGGNCTMAEQKRPRNLFAEIVIGIFIAVAAYVIGWWITAPRSPLSPPSPSPSIATAKENVPAKPPKQTEGGGDAARKMSGRSPGTEPVPSPNKRAGDDVSKVADAGPAQTTPPANPPFKFSL